MKQGTRVELPLWLGEMLAVSQRLGTMTNIISLDIPNALSPRVQNALKADPRTVDLRALAKHFYSLGERVLNLFEDEELLDILCESFKKRAAEIADYAHNPQGALGSGYSDFLKGLDETERQLFRISHESSKAIKQYMADRSTKK